MSLGWPPLATVHAALRRKFAARRARDRALRVSFLFRRPFATTRHACRFHEHAS